MSSREIKFRVWETSPFGNQMRNVDLFFFEEEDIREVPGDTRNRYEVMQYTGLKDKNGKEIYEGDILKMEDATAKVVFWERPPTFGLDYDHNEDEWCEDWNLTDDSERMEVIGNIYETPELIAKEDKS